MRAVRAPRYQDSAHTPGHEAARLWMTINVVGPNHRPASAVRSIHYSFVRDVNPLAINPHAIVTVLGFPIGIVDALRITPIAARPTARVGSRTVFAPKQTHVCRSGEVTDHVCL
jgi:hypothetical protein